MGQEKYEDLLKLLYDGSVLLFQHQQHSSGADLAKLYVEVLQKAKMKVRKDIINNLADMMSKIPTTAPERQTFLMTALSWSQSENPESKKFEGHPQLHQMVANVYWRGVSVIYFAITLNNSVISFRNQLSHGQISLYQIR